MSATFAAPVPSVLLAVELLLFEWKPRSLVPVALASATAAVLRRYILEFGPLFPVPEHPLFIGPEGLLGCVVVGLLAGGLSGLLTLSVCAAEDAFQCNIPRMGEASMKMARIILCSPGWRVIAPGNSAFASQEMRRCPHVHRCLVQCGQKRLPRSPAHRRWPHPCRDESPPARRPS